MSTSTAAMVTRLKDTDTDYEWYPTSESTIKLIKSYIDEVFYDAPSVLDCGAGDGRVLEALTSGNKYAIERSTPLIEAMSSDIFIVGTDFNAQALLDKNVTVVFSNPPYSVYEQWATKIIAEANAAVIFLVIPKRWNESLSIKKALEKRDAEAEVLGTFDFMEGDRKARAKVDVLAIKLTYHFSWSRSRPKTDPFDIWFDEHFKLDINKDSYSGIFADRDKKEAIKADAEKSLVCGRDLVSTLELLYQRDLDKLMVNYQALTTVDPELLRELDVNIDSVKGALKQKISGLKDLYWHELFDNLSKITDRLTASSRRKMLSKLTSHTHVDFTASNAHAIVIYVIKNANLYFDSQLIETFERMVNSANIKLYKSNMQTFGAEEWRFNRAKDRVHDYGLEYRVVLDRCGGLSEKGLSDTASDFLNDLCAIATNIGFDTYECERSNSFPWDNSKAVEFTFKNHTTGKRETLFRVRAFKNQNMHIQFNQRFIRRLNVVFGQLNGWLKSHQDAADELDIPVEEAIEAFGSNAKLGKSTILSLGFSPE